MIFSRQFKISELILAILLIVLGVVARLLPHAPNFTPIAAIALFSGVYLSRKLAFILPLAAMFVADLFIGFYDFPVMLAVYFSFVLTIFFALFLKQKKKYYCFFGPVASAVLFFLITNLAVFAFTPWYNKNLAGLSQCYVLALPFFKNMLLGDIFYTICLFGLFETAHYIVYRGQTSKKLLHAVRRGLTSVNFHNYANR